MAIISRLLIALMGLTFAQTVCAGPWVVGQQPITYSPSHILGDGSNSRGGEAPFYTANEPADIPTNPTIVNAWKITCSPSDIGTSCGEFKNLANGGTEAKARFDCNIAFHEKNDPILAPGIPNGSMHDHSFFGGLGFQGHAQDITYVGLRSAGGGGTNAGYSTCYGGPMNPTLYWEPSGIISVNGVTAVLEPFSIVTYYICGDSISPAAGQYGPVNCSRWGRNIDMIFGFNTSDPTDTTGHNRITAASVNGGNYTYASSNGGWYCFSPATPSYTAYAPNQMQGAHQPYINDGAGHETLNCNVTRMDGTTSCTLGTANCGYVISGDITSGECWDGQNPTSPDGRSHIIPRIRDNTAGMNVCPDHWYLIPHFESKPEFLFKSIAEIRAFYLSSDRMPGMTQFKGGESLHADLKPAWGYGTGDNPSFMVKFFVHCNGISMHLKNSDGVTYTDLVGDPHECGYGRIDSTTNAIVNGTPPDGLGPNPVVNLSPDQTGSKRFFSISNGTALTNSTTLHSH